ncbi:7588_t:CDS:1, partial [Racocetra fulgida]
KNQLNLTDLLASTYLPDIVDLVEIVDTVELVEITYRVNMITAIEKFAVN